MLKSKSWFEASRKGLAELQADKPKHYILRELIQNCWDEKSSICEVFLDWEAGYTTATVRDDNPEGFKDLRDAYVLFKKTEKRKDPTRRGIFTMGDKQAFSRCIWAEVRTTKGTVRFDAKGRRQRSLKTDAGTIVIVKFKCTKEEHEEIAVILRSYLPPSSVQFSVNGTQILAPKPKVEFLAPLTTVLEGDAGLRKTVRQTQVEVFESADPHLYEMGLPVTKIDCKYSVNIQQRVPLSVDRDTVPESYLKDLYAEVLNHTAHMLKAEEVSSPWVHMASEDDRVEKQTLDVVRQERWGDKVAIFDPTNLLANDDALSKGYRLIYGSELSKAEWGNFKEHDILHSTTQLFGKEPGRVDTPVEETDAMKKFRLGVQRISELVYGFKATCTFVNMPAGLQYPAAEYGCREITFNCRKLGMRWFENFPKVEHLDLVIHELGHQKGHHMESAYHKALTKIAGQLAMKLREDPKFLDV